MNSSTFLCDSFNPDIWTDSRILAYTTSEGAETKGFKGVKKGCIEKKNLVVFMKQLYWIKPTGSFLKNKGVSSGSNLMKVKEVNQKLHNDI